jgi:hypothetical protein
VHYGKRKKTLYQGFVKALSRLYNTISIAADQVLPLDVVLARRGVKLIPAVRPQDREALVDVFVLRHLFVEP